MEKIAYILDSSSCISEKEANELGYYYLPLHVIIEGQDYLEGENLDLSVLKKAIEAKKNVSTSQPSPGEAIELINKIKADGYDKAVFAGISSGLSKTQETVIAAAKSENYALYNIDTMGVGNTQRYAIEKVKKLISNGKSLEEAVNYVNEHEAKKHNTFALMGDLFHAARGGRVSPTAAAVGSMLKIKPILYIDFNQGGKIEILEKVRTAKKAYKRVAELLLQDVDNIDNYVIFIGDFFGAEVKQGVKDYILELQPNAKIEEGILSASIGVHTGPDSIGAMIVDTRMLKDGK